MKTWTLGELKKAIADCPELDDSTPVYLNIQTYLVAAIYSFGTTGPGGIIIIDGNVNLDDEDQKNLL